MTIPIFVITCDRLTVLKQTLASFAENIASPYKIVIHDNHSTFAPFLEYLQQLERAGVEVFRTATRVTAVEQLNEVAQTIARWYTHNDAPYYVVTDPDIALEPSDGQILNFYSDLLRSVPQVQVVGPMLRIDDLPEHYPLRDKVLALHQEQFWSKAPTRITWRGRGIDVQVAGIDTTFGMYRKGLTFRRLQLGLRTRSPYQARHLDWYLDPNDLAPDQRYYLENASTVSHWGGDSLRRALAGAPSGL